jgi:hypothetical protein
MAANLVDIVDYIVGQINLALPVASVAANRVTVCNSTLNITIGKIVTASNGDEYEVTDISNNEWVEVTPYGATTDPFPADSPTITAPAPTVVHGSPSSTDSEYHELLSNETIKKTPLIWLLEPYEYETLGRESSVDAEFSARIFFLEWFDIDTYTNDDHNKYAIKPMENLAEAFKQVMELDYNFKTLENANVKVRPRFGVEVTDKGSSKKIINEDFSGVELSPTVEVYDVSACSC